MGPLKNKKWGFVFCFITGIVVGILIGVSGFSIIVSYRMDKFYKEIAYLESTIKDKDIQLEKLEKTINTINSKELILKDIEIFLIFNGDEIDKIDIENTIKEKYSTLLGKEVEKIDADILVEVLDKRIFKIEDREYKLFVNKLILSDILKIWIRIESIENL